MNEAPQDKTEGKSGAKGMYWTMCTKAHHPRRALHPPGVGTGLCPGLTAVWAASPDAASPNMLAQVFCKPGGPWWAGDPFQFPPTLPSHACPPACCRWELPWALEKRRFSYGHTAPKPVPQGRAALICALIQPSW